MFCVMLAMCKFYNFSANATKKYLICRYIQYEEGYMDGIFSISLPTVVYFRFY